MSTTVSLMALAALHNATLSTEAGSLEVVGEPQQLASPLPNRRAPRVQAALEQGLLPALQRTAPSAASLGAEVVTVQVQTISWSSMPFPHEVLSLSVPVEVAMAWVDGRVSQDALLAAAALEQDRRGWRSRPLDPLTLEPGTAR